MSVISHPPRDSRLDTLIDWIRRRKMTDWLKIGIGAAGAVIVAWTMIQQHEYRLGQVEHNFEQHLVEYNHQYKDISATLHGIDLTLARMNANGFTASSRASGIGQATHRAPVTLDSADDGRR